MEVFGFFVLFVCGVVMVWSGVLSWFAYYALTEKTLWLPLVVALLGLCAIAAALYGFPYSITFTRP